VKQQNAIDRLERAGLSRAEIARFAGVTRHAVSHWATGRSIPSGPKLSRLVELGKSRGVVLLASDFGRPTEEAA